MYSAHSCIRIGLNARLFPNNWRPAHQEIAFAAEHGFECIQFPGQVNGLDETRLGASIHAVAHELAVARVDAVMEIVIRIDASGRTAGGKRLIDVLRANLPAITGLPCERAHVHLAPAERMDISTLRRLEQGAAPEFLEMVAVAREYGFVLGFEHNEPGIPLFATPAGCGVLLEAVPDLSFVWDFNHTPSQDLTDILALAPRMSMLHVSDTPLPATNHHLPLGLGNVDIGNYCMALAGAGFIGPAILEIGGLPKSGGYGRDTDAALIDSLHRLRAVIDPPRMSLE